MIPNIVNHLSSMFTSFFVRENMTLITDILKPFFLFLTVRSHAMLLLGFP